MRRFGESGVLVEGRSRKGLALAIAMAVPVAVGVVCGLLDVPGTEASVALLAAIEAIAFLMLPVVAPEGVLTGRRRGRLGADARGVELDGRMLLARDDVLNVTVEPLQSGERIVHLAARDPKKDIAVTLPAEDRVRAFVDVLDLDPQRHVATFFVDEDPLRTPLHRFAMRGLRVLAGVALCAGVVLLARRSELLLLALPIVLLAYLLVLPRLRVKSRVMLGADALSAKVGRRTRTIAVSSIGGVHAKGSDAIVRMRDGSEIALCFGRAEDEKARLQRDGFAAKLRDVLVGVGEHQASEALLLRDGRDRAAWLEHLRALSKTDAAYRAASLPDDALWRVADAPSADPVARVGAVVALRVRVAPTELPRLKEIASRTARADVRAAFEAAAEGASDDVIVEAFEREVSRRG